MTLTRTPNKRSMTQRRRQTRPAQTRTTPAPRPDLLLRRAASAPHLLSPGDVLQLQRTVGNRVVTQMIGSRPAPHFPPVQRDDDDISNSELNQSILHGFKREYNFTFDDFENVKVDMTGRLQEFATLAGDNTLEDYSDMVFEDSGIRRLLGQIDIHLDGRDDSDAEAKKIRNTIADLVLSASLVMAKTEETKRKLRKSHFTRYTAQTMSVAKLRQILLQMAKSLAYGNDISDTEGLKDINIGGQDSLGQRLLKLSLAQMQSGARTELQNNALFKAIVSSGDIMSIIMASGGDIEQRFLNTCSAAAVTQEIQTRITSIIGLLQVGRGTADYVDNEIQNSQFLDKWVKGGKISFRKKQTVGDLARKRVAEARQEFNRIEQQATKIIGKQPLDFAALQGLTAPWNRVMQKLAGVVNLSKDGKLPVLSKKYVHGSWGFSAFLSTVSLIGADRPWARFRDTDMEKLGGAAGQTGDLPGGQDPTVRLRDYLNQKGNNRNKRRTFMGHFWDHVAKLGGAAFSVPGHALYVKAVLQGNKRVFAIGDPKITKYEYKTIKEMEKYARKNQNLMVPKETLTQHILPAGFLVGNSDVNVYDEVKPNIYNLMAKEKRHPTINTLTVLNTIEQDILENAQISTAEAKDVGGQKFYNLDGKAPRDNKPEAQIKGLVPAANFIPI